MSMRRLDRLYTPGGDFLAPEGPREFGHEDGARETMMHTVALGAGF